MEKTEKELIHLGIEFTKTLNADNESYLSGAAFGYSCGYQAASQFKQLRREELIEWTRRLGEMGWYMEKNGIWKHDDETGHFSNTKELVDYYHPTEQITP